MKNINLNLLFEEITENFINRAPALKQIVSKYQHLTKGPYPLIKEADFNSILEYNESNAPFINKMYSANEAYINNIGYDTPIKRVYNFYQNLIQEIAKQNGAVSPQGRRKITPEEYKTIRMAINNIVNMSKYSVDKVHQGKITNDVENSNQVDLQPDNGQQLKINHSLDQTKFLKDDINRTYPYNNQNITLVDKDFSVFLNDNNQSATNIYNLIMANKKDEQFDVSTPEYRVYNLWKTLKSRCLNSMISYANLLKLSGMDPNNPRDVNQKTISKQLTDTHKIILKTLSNESDVGITYDIYSNDLKRVLHSNVEAIFDFYHLRSNSEFINKDNKNNKFLFDFPVPSVIEINGRYAVRYFLNDREGEICYMKIHKLKTKSVESFHQINSCNAADELKKLVYNIKNNI